MDDKIKEILEEIGAAVGAMNTGISGMVDTQPIGLAGEQMTPVVGKERRNTQKNAGLRYKYKKSWGKNGTEVQ